MITPADVHRWCSESEALREIRVNMEKMRRGIDPRVSGEERAKRKRSPDADATKADAPPAATVGKTSPAARARAIQRSLTAKRAKG